MLLAWVSRLSSAKATAPVIMDGKRLSEDEEDEDEQFVVEEAVPPPSDAPEMDVVGAFNRDVFKKCKSWDSHLSLLLFMCHSRSLHKKQKARTNTVNRPIVWIVLSKWFKG